MKHVTLIILVVLLGLASQAIYTIQETEQAIITQFGEYMRSITEPGLKLKIPFIQQVHRLERRVLVSDAPSSEYLTRDMKRIRVDHVTRWRIADPFKFFTSVRTEAGALSRLDDIVSGRLREEIARYDFMELIRDSREEAMESVTLEARIRAADFGIEVLDNRIKRLDLPTQVERSVFDRMEAERNRMASRYRAEGQEQARVVTASAERDKEIILARAYQTAQQLRGEGDAQATAIYAQAYERDPEFYSFLKRLEMYQLILPGATLVLSAESDLFRYLETPVLER